MSSELDVKYLIDRIIENAEKNIEMQGETLNSLHSLRGAMESTGRDHEDIKAKLDEVFTKAEATWSLAEAVQHRGILDKIGDITREQIDHAHQMSEDIISLSHKLDIMSGTIGEIKSIYTNVRNLLWILSGIVTVGMTLLAILKGIME
jgi:hypothetical protein